MADPLSVTAVIIAVIQLTSTVGDLCFDYRKAVKGAAKDAARITNEVDELRSVLKDLLSIAEEEEEAGTHRLVALSKLTQPGGSLEKCREELNVLKIRLEPKYGSLHMKSSLTWPFKAGEIETALNGLNTLKSTLQLAMTADSAKSIFRVEDSMGRLEIWTQKLKMSDAQRALFEWLRAPDPSVNHHTARHKYEPGTGEWLLHSDGFKDWLKYKKMFLWIYGLPGSGKTILASTIISHVKQICQRQGSQHLLYFYFTFNDQRKRDMDGVLRSLLAQIVASRTVLPEQIKQLYDSNNKGQQQPDLASLRSTLLSVLETSDTYLVLDAADECLERAGLLELINDVKDNCPNVNILITSRREVDLEENFQGESKSMICIEDDVVSHDIQLHVQSQLKSDKQLQRWPEDLKAEVEAALVLGAKGMFRWVACQLDVLRDCLKPKLIRKKLGDLPKNLNETYDRILRSVPEPHLDDVHRALQWLIFSQRPMTLTELAEAVAVSVDEECFDVKDRFTSPFDILRLCASLVNLQGAEIDQEGKAIENEARAIGLAHYSVAEYLISDHIRNSEVKSFAVTPQKAHEYMAKSSLLYLESFDKNNSLYGSVHDDFPFLIYAARNWLDHFRAVLQPSKRLLESGCSFLQDASRPAYLNWLKLYDKNMGVDITPSGLYFACESGLPQLSKLLLDNGADANAQGDYFGNALQIAAALGHIDTVRLLLDRGADVNASGGEYGTALQAAACHQYIDIVQFLLDRGADVNAQEGRHVNALQAAVYKRSVDMIRLLLDRGADVTAQSWKSGNALQAAIEVGSIDIVRLLVDRGANVNAQEEYEGSALASAALRNEFEIAHFLLDRGADVNAQVCYGTALQAAIHFNRTEMAQFLLDRGADVNAQGPHGTALEMAESSGNIHLKRLLSGRGADDTGGCASMSI